MGVVDDGERPQPPALEDAGLRAFWDELEEPPFAGVPPGFSARVMSRARAEAASAAGLGWAGAPRWAKAAAVVALAGGAALGAGLTALVRDAESSVFEEESTLAERYATSLEEADQ